MEREALNKILTELEELREKMQESNSPVDYTIRCCEAVVANHAGYETRADWAHLQK